MTEQNGQHRVIFAGGGTAGHLMPAINIALEMKRLDDRLTPLFIGRRGGMEAPIVAKFGFQLKEIDVTGLKRSPTGVIRFIMNWNKSARQAIDIMREFDPLVVIGSGGYVSAPVVRAGVKLGKPIFLQEQNSLPGLATRSLGKFASAIFTAYESASKYLPPEKCRQVGNPIRPDILGADRRAALDEFGLAADRKTLLVVGGSSGARGINQAVLDLVNSDFLPGGWQVLWQTGQKDFDSLSQQVLPGKLRGKMQPFIFNMPGAYAVADLILSRAGAMALAEIAAWGLPSALVPYPHATGGHQRLNAREFESSGAAAMVYENNIAAELKNVLNELLNDDKKRSAMSAKARGLARPDAAEKIARTILDKIDEIQKN